ncbi:pyruvate kinase [bacterium]|nr:pyruvate kinase [bacterium]
MARTKIVCTIGPACAELETMRAMLRAGMSVARLNFSHGNPEQMSQWVGNLREAARLEQKHLCILQDLSGPKVRIGRFAEGKVFLRPGDHFVLTERQVPGDQNSVTVPIPHLSDLCAGTGRLMLADGMLELKVLSVEGDDVHTEVVVGGWLSDRKGISFPGQALPIDPLTKKDLADLKTGLALDVDYVALSFVRNHKDIRQLRQLLREAGSEARVCAKLERPEALDDLEAIIQASDAVMVARGDLGIELAPEKVPLAQKRIICEAQRLGVYVITATQMLESMIANAWPTRAEASDVANAVLDGTDAVMLSGESATGEYPVRAVEMMTRIIEETETSPLLRRDRRREGQSHLRTVAGSISWAAAELAEMNDAKAICAFTQSGATARLIAKSQPEVPIIGLSPNPRVLRQMNLARGVRPVQARDVHSLDEMVHEVERLALQEGFAAEGEPILITAGFPFGPPHRTNLLKVHKVGDLS